MAFSSLILLSSSSSSYPSSHQGASPTEHKYLAGWADCVDGYNAKSKQFDTLSSHTSYWWSSTSHVSLMWFSPAFHCFDHPLGPWSQLFDEESLNSKPTDQQQFALPTDKVKRSTNEDVVGGSSSSDEIGPFGECKNFHIIPYRMYWRWLTDDLLFALFSLLLVANTHHHYIWIEHSPATTTFGITVSYEEEVEKRRGRRHAEIITSRVTFFAIITYSADTTGGKGSTHVLEWASFFKAS